MKTDDISLTFGQHAIYIMLFMAFAITIIACYFALTGLVTHITVRLFRKSAALACLVYGLCAALLISSGYFMPYLVRIAALKIATL